MNFNFVNKGKIGCFILAHKLISCILLIILIYKLNNEKQIFNYSYINRILFM